MRTSPLLPAVIGFLLLVAAAIVGLYHWDDPEMRAWYPPTVAYGEVIGGFGPFNLVLHALALLAVGGFFWCLWKQRAQERLFLFALLPLVFGSLMMGRQIGLLLDVLGQTGIHDPAAMAGGLWPVVQFFYVLGGTTAVLCVIAEVAWFLQRGGQVRPAGVLATLCLVMSTISAKAQEAEAAEQEYGNRSISTRPYLESVIASGPVAMFLHLLLWLCPFIVWRSLWKRASRWEPFVCALLPSVLGAGLMWLSVLGMMVVMGGHGFGDSITSIERLLPIQRVFHIASAMTVALLAIAGAVVVLRDRRTKENLAG